MRKIRIEDIEREFNLVREELYEVGLLRKGNAFDETLLCQSSLPSLAGEMGYVYDTGLSFMEKVMGYEEGVIYIPSYAPIDKWVPGGTLRDTIRHEFGHIWAWISPGFFRKRWFTEVFGAPYWNADHFGEKLFRLFSKNPEEFKRSPYYSSHVSPYALFSPAEDLSETFMHYLKYRKRYSKFKVETELDMKIKAIKKAISSWKDT